MAVNEARYVPDLTGLMAECETNYARLLKLMPDTGLLACKKVGVTYPSGQTVTACFELLEDFRYTSTVRIRQMAASGKWLNMPSMVVRLYHDANMAEVVDAENMRQLKGIYPYPNEQMHHADEKVQRNLYLGEWLCYCLQHGHVLEDMNVVGV